MNRKLREERQAPTIGKSARVDSPTHQKKDKSLYGFQFNSAKRAEKILSLSINGVCH